MHQSIDLTELMRSRYLDLRSKTDDGLDLRFRATTTITPMHTAACTLVAEELADFKESKKRVAERKRERERKKRERERKRRQKDERKRKTKRQKEKKTPNAEKTKEKAAHFFDIVKSIIYSTPLKRQKNSDKQKSWRKEEEAPREVVVVGVLVRTASSRLDCALAVPCGAQWHVHHLGCGCTAERRSRVLPS